jgi:PAS domain S-box-containing protein
MKTTVNIEETNKQVITSAGLIIYNFEGNITCFNNAASEITGYTADEVINSSIELLFDKVLAENQVLYDSPGDNKDDIILLVNRKGNDCTRVHAVILSIIDSPDKTSSIILLRHTQEDNSLNSVLDEKNREIIQEKNKLETIFNSLLEGTFTINTEWEITSFNRAAEGITGFTVSEAIGKKYWQVFPSEEGTEDLQLKAFIADHHPALLRETTIIRKDGSRILVRINSAPLMDANGNQTGRVVTFEDISIMKNLSEHIEEKFHFKNIIGRSKPMMKVFNLMENVINTDSTVLITGESGTGKEIIARAIHLNSEKKSEPFIAVNCTAFAETLLESELFGHEKGAFTGAIRTKPGRFELAGNGTLFLDEIGDIPMSVQVKLLRVLENRQFERAGGTVPLHLSARIITATNKNLEEEVAEGRFREDLYYRINVINIHLPSLYERRDDIPGLVSFFMEKFRNKFKKDIFYISPNTLKVISHYRWPGNIRELENVIEHAFVVCNSNVIRTEHLPARLQDTINELKLMDENYTPPSPLENAEKQLIESTLIKLGGNRLKTAAELGINKSTLWRKMKKYNLL